MAVELWMSVDTKQMSLPMLRGGGVDSRRATCSFSLVRIRLSSLCRFWRRSRNTSAATAAEKAARAPTAMAAISTGLSFRGGFRMRAYVVYVR